MLACSAEDAPTGAQLHDRWDRTALSFAPDGQDGGRTSAARLNSTSSPHWTSPARSSPQRMQEDSCAFILIRFQGGTTLTPQAARSPRAYQRRRGGRRLALSGSSEAEAEVVQRRAKAALSTSRIIKAPRTTGSARYFGARFAGSLMNYLASSSPRLTAQSSLPIPRDTQHRTPSSKAQCRPGQRRRRFQVFRFWACSRLNAPSRTARTPTAGRS